MRGRGAFGPVHIVKGNAEAAGFDARVFSGHSLRAGFVTSALAALSPPPAGEAPSYRRQSGRPLDERVAEAEAARPS